MASRGDAVVDRFRATLHNQVAETLRSVCGAFQKELELAARPPAPAQVDYDTYNDCCQRLVRYIAEKMDTSPYFIQQMDRIILACHSGTSEQVLSSLVTKDVWLRPRKKGGAEEKEEEVTAVDANGEAVDEMFMAYKEPVVKEERTPVNEASSASNTSMQLEASAASGSLPRQGPSSAGVTPSTGSARSKRKRPSSAQELSTTAPVAKKKRQEIDIFSSASEEDTDKSKVETEAGLFSRMFGTDTETEEDEDEQEGKQSANVDDEDEDDEDWFGSGNEEASDDDEAEAGRPPVVDTIGTLCCPEGRSPSQTTAVRERLRKSIALLDATLCRPPPGKYCSRNCQQLRGQWCQNVGPCGNEMCKLMHETDAHIACCRNKKHCEFSILVMLHEALHQIEHQHTCIAKVRFELNQRRSELSEANAARLFNPPSRVALLTKQVELLERELASEEEQMELYLCVKRVNTDAANEINIDTAAEFADFRAHYTNMAARDALSTSAAQPAAMAAPARQAVPKKDDLLPPNDDTIGKLCYGGQRSQQQTQVFKECLRKSIKFIDALLCKPPVGKVCARDCKKIQAQRCADDVPCANGMCRNWHYAEAHIDNCRNPQCEMKLRIVLRETLHGIEEKSMIVQRERVQLQEKKKALKAIMGDESSEKENHKMNVGGAARRDSLVEAALQDEIEQLEQDFREEEKELQMFISKKKELADALYTIGIDETDDIIDGFPDLKSHYRPKKKSRRH